MSLEHLMPEPGEFLLELYGLATLAGQPREDKRKGLKKALIIATKRQQLEPMFYAALGHHKDCPGKLADALRFAFNRSGSLFCPSSLEETTLFDGYHAEVFAEGLAASIFDTSLFDAYDCDALEEWMNEMGYREVNYRYYPEDDVCACRSCGNPMLANDGTDVIARHGSETWCETCVNNNAFNCELTDSFYSNTYFTQRLLTDGTTFCLEECENQELVEWSDRTEAWYRYGDAPNDSILLPDYHHAARPWANPRAKIPAGAIGVELEMGFDSGDEDRESFLESNIDPASDGRLIDLPFSVERDGSLDDCVPGGMELISDPLPYQSGYRALNSPWRRVLTELLRHGACGWKYREYAGLHVNLDARGMSDADIFKYATFINNATALSQFVAGRTSIYQGSYQKKASAGLRHNGLHWAKDDLLGEGKYAPVFLHEDSRTRRLETRIFGSNLKYEGFMACVEYCTSALEYTRGVEPIDVFSPTLGPEYRHWLANHTERFPFIAQRLGVIAADSAVQKIQPLRAVA